MTALLGLGAMAAGLVAFVLVCALLHKMWEAGLLQLLLSLGLLGLGIWFFAINIYRDALWLGEKIQGAF